MPILAPRAAYQYTPLMVSLLRDPVRRARRARLAGEGHFVCGLIRRSLRGLARNFEGSNGVSEAGRGEEVEGPRDGFLVSGYPGRGLEVLKGYPPQEAKGGLSW